MSVVQIRLINQLSDTPFFYLKILINKEKLNIKKYKFIKLLVSFKLPHKKKYFIFLIKDCVAEQINVKIKKNLGRYLKRLKRGVFVRHTVYGIR